MRFWLILAIACVPVTWEQALGGTRDKGSGDVSRHSAGAAERGKRDLRERDRVPIVAVPRPDPAVQSFWSDRCVDQRRSGKSHTKDCDNPAYTGGGYVDIDPYRGNAPRGGYRPRPYVPGGGIYLNRGSGRSFQYYRDWGSRPARGGVIKLR
jgi:hypothetical protein